MSSKPNYFEFVFFVIVVNVVVVVLIVVALHKGLVNLALTFPYPCLKLASTLP